MSILADIREAFSELIPLQRRTRPAAVKHIHKNYDKCTQMPYGSGAAGLVIATKTKSATLSDEDLDEYSLDRLGFPVIIFSDDQPYDDLDEDEGIDFTDL